MKQLSLVLLVGLLSSCALISYQSKARTERGNYVITKITSDGIQTCTYERCDIQLGTRRIVLSSPNYNVDIAIDHAYDYWGAIGYDQHHKEWDVQLSATKRDMYLMILTSDSISLSVGYKCDIFKPYNDGRTIASQSNN